ncbi:MAG: hypothetical protein DMG89_17235 [Acidobacteria bacterium]|nr:MAG: hypothetical protein DMG89_17235 [Acidobacteriota bacterium]
MTSRSPGSTYLHLLWRKSGGEVNGILRNYAFDKPTVVSLRWVAGASINGQDQSNMDDSTTEGQRQAKTRHSQQAIEGREGSKPLLVPNPR